MLLGFIVETAVGLLCIVLGLLIRKKRKVTLIHDCHYKNVAKDLYEHEVLNYKEYETILDINKPIENAEKSFKITENEKIK